MIAQLHLKPTTDFADALARGALAQEVVAGVMRWLGHDPAPLDAGAGTTEIYLEAGRKRQRRSDLVCSKCGLRVEVKSKTRPALCLSHSAARPFWDEHEPDEYLAIVTCYGVWFFSFAGLIATHLQAQTKVNRYGEPYLQWPRGIVGAAKLPLCKEGAS